MLISGRKGVFLRANLCSAKSLRRRGGGGGEEEGRHSFILDTAKSISRNLRLQYLGACSGEKLTSSTRPFQFRKNCFFQALRVRFDRVSFQQCTRADFSLHAQTNCPSISSLVASMRCSKDRMDATEEEKEGGCAGSRVCSRRGHPAQRTSHGSD